MKYVEEILKPESVEFCEGFLEGVRAFAHWKDGEQWVGTTGRKFKTVKQEVAKIVRRKKEVYGE